MIEIDLVKRTINVELSDEEIAGRQEAWRSDPLHLLRLLVTLFVWCLNLNCLCLVPVS